MKPLKLAIEKAGGVTTLASRIGVSVSAPYMWLTRNHVPAEHCPAIERETGVLCEELNSKPDWAFLRNTNKTKAKK
jgi:DNA-binding transcriptional regulator YdaS (Cro superfamily)